MNKLLFITMATFLLSGCGHGRTQYFPKEGNDNSHALVTIVRSQNAGGGLSTKVVLDGRVIAYIKTSEYIKFHVEPGIHATCLQEALIVMPFEKRIKYYFLITFNMWRGNYECEYIKQETFEELIKIKWFDGTEYRDYYEEQDPNLKETQ